MEVEEEIEALEAILEETLEIERNAENVPVKISVALQPLTASQEEKKFVALTFRAELPAEYPDVPPLVKIMNPRGLDETGLDSLMSDISSKCDDFAGHPVLFELIDLCREFLTASNVPACQCAICLDNIKEHDVFSKTVCYHYFHSFCLGRYIRNAEETHAEEQKKNVSPRSVLDNPADTSATITCPVCREVLPAYDLKQLLSSRPPEGSAMTSAPFVPDFELKTLQRKMQKLFLRQQQKGGIIDLDAEERKFLVTISTSNSVSNFEDSSPSSSDLPVLTDPIETAPTPPPPEPVAPKADRRQRGRGGRWGGGYYSGRGYQGGGGHHAGNRRQEGNPRTFNPDSERGPSSRPQEQQNHAGNRRQEGKFNPPLDSERGPSSRPEEQQNHIGRRRQDGNPRTFNHPPDSERGPSSRPEEQQFGGNRRQAGNNTRMSNPPPERGSRPQESTVEGGEKPSSGQRRGNYFRRGLSHNQIRKSSKSSKTEEKL